MIISKTPLTPKEREYLRRHGADAARRTAKLARVADEATEEALALIHEGTEVPTASLAPDVRRIRGASPALAVAKSIAEHRHEPDEPRRDNASRPSGR